MFLGNNPPVRIAEILSHTQIIGKRIFIRMFLSLAHLNVKVVHIGHNTLFNLCRVPSSQLYELEEVAIVNSPTMVILNVVYKDTCRASNCFLT